MIIDFFMDLWHINRCKEYARYEFVCPNCGNSFFTKWYRLWLGRENTIVLCKKAKLKCPHCKETDMCRWTAEWNA